MNKIIIIFISFHFFLFGQNTLLDDLKDTSKDSYVVSNIFKGSRVVNLQTTELVKSGILQFIMSHRFGAINKGLYTLFGLDEAEIRFDFQYGLNKKINIGVGRDSYEKTYESFIKIKLKDQSRNKNSFPVAIAYFSAIFINTENTGPTMSSHFNNRLSFVNQMIFSRKISKKLSLEIVPTFVHRNFVTDAIDPHDTFAIGLGAAFSINPWITFNSEYGLRVGSYSEQYQNSISFGFDIETGGHVFQIHMTNSQGMFERAFISETMGDWETGDVYLGFNLSRPFQIK